MESNLEQDIESQLQVELKRLQKVIEYIEKANVAYNQSKQILDNSNSKFAEMSDKQVSLNRSLQERISEIESEIKNIQNVVEATLGEQLNLIQQDIQELSNKDSLITEIDNIKSEIVNQKKLIGTNFRKQISEFELKIDDIDVQIKSFETKFYILFFFWIITFIIAVIL